MSDDSVEHVGRYVPEETIAQNFERAPGDQLARLRSLPGLTATVSDALERLGLRLCVSADTLTPRHRREIAVVGHAITLGYLPQRANLQDGSAVPSRLAHGTAASMAQAGDVLVIDAGGDRGVSCFGGLAARTAREAGLAGVIVDGSARDLDEIESDGVALWTAGVTPLTGNRRLEAASINKPIRCAGVQVRPGDIVVADSTGICFIPIEAFAQLFEQVIDASRREADLLAAK